MRLIARFSSPSRRPRRRLSCAARRWGAAALASLVFHGAVVAALWRAAPIDTLSLLAPQTGRASIALSASIAATAEQSSPAEFEITPQEKAPPEDPDNPLDDAPAQVADIQIDREDVESPARLFAPAEPPMVVVEEAAAQAIVGGEAERRAGGPSPPVTETSASKSPARRSFSPAPSPPAAVSLPSPASQAQQGVETDEPPQVVFNRAPLYPPEVLAAGRTGRVVIRAEIAADGSVLRAAILRSSGVAALDRAAREAVARWRFSPAQNAGAEPRPVNVPIDFVIRGRRSQSE
jgi:periplasmic protein TonB